MKSQNTLTRWIAALPLIASLSIGSLALTGCETAAGTGTLIGAGTGALLGGATGAAIGGHHRGHHGARDGAAVGTLLGAAAGAGTGYLIGKQIDKNRQQDAAIQQAQIEANTIIINVHNSNGSLTPVRLVRQGNVWVGPRGETYTAMPTEDQLRPVYGF
ncbi:MAG: glycine zipper domain-containing protein [Candidatus Sumerlaeia bacterium]|nr:glycine zipper domain-containing protein [Candidatus Sumerlaeia bacterium]